VSNRPSPWIGLIGEVLYPLVAIGLFFCCIYGIATTYEGSRAGFFLIELVLVVPVYLMTTRETPYG
jgi:hypothetical protein